MYEEFDGVNFVVIGSQRSGLSILQTSLSSHPSAVCHGELLHPSEADRIRLYHDYFGTSEDTELAWFVPVNGSAEQFLSGRVFDRALRGERAIGVTLSYREAVKYNLWEYLHDRCLDGDFCVLSVRRNPLACYVSEMQAKQTGLRTCVVSDNVRLYAPSPVELNVRDLTAFCREQLACDARLSQLCSDRLEIEFIDLLVDYRRVISTTFEFLGLSPHPNARPGVRRLKNRSLADRIVNFDELRSAVPSDIRYLFEPDNLF